MNYPKIITLKIITILRKCALKFYFFCSTTYRCESLFSNMVYLNYRNNIIDAQLDDCLRAVVVNYTPNYNKLVKEIQWQIIH